MPSLNIIPEGDGCWPELAELAADGQLINAMEDRAKISLAFLEAGMQSGKPSITIRIDLPDGRVVITETSGMLFMAAARAFAAKFGDILE